MRISSCDLCGKSNVHVKKKAVRYEESLLTISDCTTVYDVCDECDSKIELSKIKAEFDTVSEIRRIYKDSINTTTPPDNPEDNVVEDNSDDNLNNNNEMKEME